MAASPKPSLQDVVKALKTLTNEETQSLVVRFGVKLHVLVDIEAKTIPKIRCLQAWLDRDTEASWEKIVFGLQEIEKAVLAKEIATRHCPQSSPSCTDPSNRVTALAVQPVSTTAEIALATPSVSAVDSVPPPMLVSDPTQPLPVPPWSVAKVKATILQLKKKFSVLTANAKIEISKKESQDKSFLEIFRTSLQLLPVSEKPSHAKFFKDSEEEIDEAENTRKIFCIFCRYLNYRNYEILFHIIVMFCDAPLQKSMQEYCKMLEEFEMATTVDVFKCAISAGKKLSLAFSEMVVKIKKPSSECRLCEIRKLKEEIAEGSSLHLYNMYIDSEEVQCVVVVLRFPSSAAGWVMGAMTSNFMHTHHLIEVAMDGEYLTVEEGDVDELVSVHVHKF